MKYSGNTNYQKIKQKKYYSNKGLVYYSNYFLHISGYKKTGTGESWAATSKTAITIKAIIIGINQYFFDFKIRIKSCLIVANITKIKINLSKWPLPFLIF